MRRHALRATCASVTAGGLWVVADEKRRDLACRSAQLARIWAPVVLRHSPSEIASRLDASGPVFIKLGQWLSSRRDLFSTELCDAMGVLHEQVTAHASAADASLVQDLAPGASLGDLLGAGCIARVYRGCLADGTPVAVKVRRENVQSFLELDLRLLRFFLAIVDACRPDLRWLTLDKALDDFACYMLNQTDFRTEAANLKRFAANLAGCPASVPAVYLANECVLVMELIEGDSLSKILHDKFCHSPELRKRLWSVLSDQTARMVLKSNFVHADLHPGNIMVKFEKQPSMFGLFGTKTVPKLVFIDAGMAFELQEATVGHLKNAMRGVVKCDTGLIGQAFVDLHSSEGLCDAHNPVLSQKLGVLGLCCVFTQDEPYWSQLFPSKSAYLGARVPEYFHRMAAIFTAHEVRISPSLWTLLTSFALIEGSLHELGFETNVMRAALPYLVSSPADMLNRILGSLRMFLSERASALFRAGK